jgi:hypothetical protein
LDYFPVATVDGENTIGNTVPRNWTRTYEWCIGNEVVSVQKLNILVDAAPVPALDVDSIAELPYAYNFDEGTDPYFMIENGENVNKWVVGTAQGFDNNKLYISPNNGTTNKYDVTKASNVIAYRTVMVPAAGAILSFDYRVNGQANNDYLRVSLAKGGIATEIATLQGENEWNTFSYDISGEMAGEVRIQFNWVNNASAGEQFPAAIDNISVIETPCSQPTALTATVDSTTAVITWVAAEGQDAWNFEYKLADHSEWYSIAADDTTVTLNNLQGNSNYNMRVQAVCSENSSAWTNGTFAVACQTEEVVTAPDDVPVGDGTSTYYYFPINMYFNYSLTQQLYTPAEIGSEGNIYSISFYYTNSSSFSMSDVKLYMKNVNKTAFESNTDMVEVSNNDLVWEGTFSASDSGWVTINLPTPFEYDGTSNLLVCMYDPTYGYAGNSYKFRTTTTSNYSSITWHSDSYVPEINATSFSGSKSYNKYHNNLMLNRDVTTITCSDVVSCETPSNLEVPEAGITPNSAVLTWTAGAENQTTFLVEYKAEADAEYASAEVNDTTYTLEGLAQLTNYNVRVKAICDTNDWSEVISADFRTLGVCAPVSNLETSNESNTTTLTWTAGGDENAWLVQFKPASADEDAWISIPVEYITMTTFGGLQGNTDYVVRVKATCDPDDEENQSEWVSTTFHSGCAPTDVPFAENFMTTSMPDCWDGKDFTFTYNDGAYTYTDGAWLISPAINIPAENTTYLTVKAKGYSGGNYTVLASYRGTRADRFEEIYNGTVTGQATEAIIPLADVYKGRTVNFKIVANGTNNMYFTAVKVNQCPFVPTNLTASNITGTTVDLAWEANEAATNFQVKAGEQTWDVEGANELTIEGLDYNTTYSFEVRANCGDDNYGIWSDAKTVTTKPACSQPTNLQYEALTSTSYFLEWTASEWTQGAGTQYVVGYKAAGEADYTELEPTDTTFTTLGSLQGQTTYTVAVKAVCSEEYSSEWSTYVTFTTLCAPKELPYTEGFEDYEGTTYNLNGVVPDCWDSYATGSVKPHVIISGGNYAYINTGEKALTFYGSGDCYAIMPNFEANISELLMKFWMKTESASYGKLTLGYITLADNNMNTFTSIEEFSNTQSGAYRIPDLSQVPANANRLVFKWSYTSQWSCCIDDISIDYAPTCYTPSITVNGTTLIATITPSNSGNPAQSYDLQIGNQIVPNVTVSSENTVDLMAAGFTFEPNTEYEINVRANCGGDDYSEWMEEPVSFTTACTAMNLPYTEDFESYSTPSYYYYEGVMPDCWDDNWTAVATSSSNHYEPKVLNYAYYQPGQGNYLYLMAGGSYYSYYQDPTWVVLPVFNADLNTAMISFRARGNNSSYATYGALYLGYVNDDNEFTQIAPVTVATSANAPLQTIMLDNNYHIPEGVRLAFKADYTYSSTSSAFHVGIDDITVKQIPACDVPSNITVNNGVATITRSNIGNTPVSYDLQIGEEEATVNVASEGPTTVDLTEHFSLVLGEEYDMQVVTNCEEGTSEPLSVHFKYEVSYTIDEAESITTCNATLYDDGGANGNYADSKNYTVTIYPETSNSLIHLQGDYVTESISYDYIQIYDGTSTSATQLGKFGGTGSIDVTASNADGALTVYFRSDVSGNYSGFAFNITCEEKPTCDVPTINVEGATATITSGAFGIPVSYDLQIGEEIKSISASAEQTSVDLMELFSLDLNTEYYVSVRSVCSAEDVSDWSAPEKVTTPVCEGAVVVDLSSGTNTFNYLPTYTFYNYSYTQQIYLSSDINLPAGGQITAISFEVKEGAATRDIDVYMMNSTATSLESGTAWLDITTATQVYSGTISFALGWNEIQLTTPFDYNGTDNLILIVDDNTGGYVSSPKFGTHSTTGNLAKYKYDDYTNYNPYSISASGTVTTNRNNIKFNVCPAPTCFIPNNLTVSEINDNSAVLTWEVNSRNPETVSYVVEYKAAADEEWQSAPVSELTYALNGLTASTDYMVRVKTDCGNADESAYAEIEFSTLCPFGYYDENEQLVCPAANDFKVTAIKSTFVDACEVEGDLTIEVANMGYAETVSTYTAFYQINNETPVKEIVNLTTPLNFQETATYTFSQTPAFVSGENVITTWVVNGAYEEDVTSADEFIGTTLFSEDFENAESSEIIIIDNDGDGYNWELLNSDEYSHAGEYCAASASYANYVGALYPDNWMVLPAVNIPAEGANLNWWVAAQDPAWPEEHYEVYVATAGGEIVDFTSIYEETLTSGEWEQRTLDLSAYAGQDIQLAFVHNECSDNYMMKIDDIAVKAGESVPMVVSAPITVLEPAAVPYVENFNGELKGWNAIDANEDGITMNLNNNINYKFNDELDADDWMMSPCIQMPAGTYTIIYDIKANSSLTESFEVFYGNGAHIADMTNVLATHTFNNTTVETATTTITISEEEAGIYNFGFHATSMAGNLGFTIDNFKVYPVNDVIITYAENGTVTPHDTVHVNYGESLTLSIVPATSYHVGGILVDGEQVVPEDGNGANFMLYTLENVTAPHTVFVDFKLEFHIFKSVENYRPDLYDEKGGKFVNTELAIDTTINSTPFTVNMVADPHYHLAGLTLSMANTGNEEDVTADVMDNNDGTYSYTIDTLIVANYYVNATFRRDTVDINYTVLTGKGYANDSELLDATDNTNNTYTTWVDYSIYNDVDTTVTFAAADNYHIVKVYVNGEDKGKIDNYRFENVTETQNVDIKFGYMINTVVSNYNTYDNIQEPQGTLDPDTQYIPEFDPMTVYGTVAENFHLYQLLVNGENRIDEVVFTDRHNYSFTMDSVDNNYTIEAVVKVDTFAINYIIVAGQGTADASELLVAPDTFATVLNYADDWMSTITPDLGFTIANVTLDGENLYTASNNQFNYITEDHTFMVTFAPETYTITTNAYGQGTVSDGVTITFDPENPFDYEFTATPAEGYYVSAVFINNEAQDLTDVEGEYTTTIENVADNYVINAHFSIYTYTMTAEAGEGGSITPDGIQTVNYGSEMQYDIVANTGWYISSIDVDGDVTEYTQDDDLTVWNVAFLGINDNHNVSATFEQYVYTITATASENGTVDGAEAITYNVTYGENRTVNFLPDANYHIADVVVDGVSVGAVDYYEFINVMEDHTVNVVFEATMYTLTATSNIAACTITPEVTTVQAGENVEYSLTVANGYHLVNVIANNEEVTVTNNAFTISDVQSDYTIYANFAQNNVTVTVNQPDHATITPGTMTYAYGATPTYIIVPEVGYDIVSVTAGNAVVNVTYNNGIGTFTLAPVLADITLTATTRIKKFEITVTQGANGTITPGTQTNVEYGTSKTFTITPNDFYVIADVIVDGSSRGSLSTYTFNNITANHTITAVFEANCQTPTNLTAMDIDTTSAVVSWVGTAPSYEVRYKTADNPLYTTQTVTTNSLELTDLVPNTLYSWGVRAVCGSNMYSEWAINAFTTKALPLGPVDGIANAELSSVKVYSHLNNVYIVNEEGVAISNVDIYDIYGKQVYTGKVLNSPEVISLNVANGNYVVRLATENGVGIYKVAIVK